MIIHKIFSKELLHCLKCNYPDHLRLLVDQLNDLIFSAVPRLFLVSVSLQLHEF